MSIWPDDRHKEHLRFSVLLCRKPQPHKKLPRYPLHPTATCKTELPQTLQAPCQLVEKRVETRIITLLGVAGIVHSCLLQIVHLGPQHGEALLAPPAPAHLSDRLQHSLGVEQQVDGLLSLRWLRIIPCRHRWVGMRRLNHAREPARKTMVVLPPTQDDKPHEVPTTARATTTRPSRPSGPRHVSSSLSIERKLVTASSVLSCSAPCILSARSRARCLL
jgi:hypothetical protein